METPHPSEPRPWTEVLHRDLADRTFRAVFFLLPGAAWFKFIHATGTPATDADYLGFITIGFCLVFCMPIPGTFTSPREWRPATWILLQCLIAAAVSYCFTLIFTQDLVRAMVNAVICPILIPIFSGMRVFAASRPLKEATSSEVSST